MKKKFIRFLNLIYIAAAGLSIYSLCTRPMYDIDLQFNLSGDKVGDLLSAAAKESETEGETRLPSRVTKKTVADILTPERVALAFEDGLKLDVHIIVPSEAAFDLDNKDVLVDLVNDNVDRVINSAVDAAIPPFRILLKDVSREYSEQSIRDSINSLINKYFTNGDEVTPEEVAAIFEAAYATLENGEPVDINDLSAAIMPQVINVLNKRLEDGAGTTEYPYDPDSLSVTQVSSGIADSLESVPGMVNTSYIVADPQPTQAEYESGNTKYFVKTEDGEIAEVSGDYNSEAVYYVIDKQTVNDRDAVLSYLVGTMLGEENKKPEETEEGTRLVLREEIKQSEADLRKNLDKLLRERIPLEAITNAISVLGDSQVYILLALAIFSILPWALFAFFTLLRTFRKKKVWAKPGFVFVFAFPQLVSGIIATGGSRNLLPLLQQAVPGMSNLLDSLTLSVMNATLIPSLVYLGMLVFTVFYAIVVHKTKVEYRTEKRLKKEQKKAA